MKKATFFLICTVSVIFTFGCSTDPVGGVLVSECPNYVKVLSENDIKMIKDIISRVKKENSDDFASIEKKDGCALLFNKKIYLKARDNVYILQCSFSETFTLYREEIPSEKKESLPAYKDNCVIFASQEPSYITYRLSDNDSGILYQICTPWRSEDEERRSIEAVNLENGLFPAEEQNIVDDGRQME